MAVDLGNGATGDRRPRALARRDVPEPSPIGGGSLTCGGTCAGPRVARCDKLRPMLFPGRMRALGLAASLLVLAMVSRPTPAAAFITGFHITPSNFSPNGDGVKDLTTIA